MNLFDIVKLKQDIEDLEKQTMAENFWNDSANSSKILTEINDINERILSRRMAHKLH